jgi:hypothetical protein
MKNPGPLLHHAVFSLQETVCVQIPIQFDPEIPKVDLP